MNNDNWYTELLAECKTRGVSITSLHVFAGVSNAALSKYRVGGQPTIDIADKVNDVLKKLNFKVRVPDSGMTLSQVRKEAARLARVSRDNNTLQKAVSKVELPTVPGPKILSKHSNGSNINDAIFIEAMKAIILGRYGTGLPVTPKEVVEIAYGIADEAAERIGI